LTKSEKKYVNEYFKGLGELPENVNFVFPKYPVSAPLRKENALARFSVTPDLVIMK
jgi:hypothetical protein